MALKSKGSRVRFIDLARIRRRIKRKYPSISLGLESHNAVVSVRVGLYDTAIAANGLTQTQLEKEIESWISETI